MGKAKRWVALITTISLVAAGTYKGLGYVKEKNKPEVIVVDVSSIETEDYYNYETSDASLSGSITTNVMQNIKIDKDIIVKDLLVNVGDDVKKGDLLMTIDTTLTEMELGIAELEYQRMQQSLDTARARLYSLQNGGPIEESSPETGINSEISEGIGYDTDPGYYNDGFWEDYYTDDIGDDDTLESGDESSDEEWEEDSEDNNTEDNNTEENDSEESENEETSTEEDSPSEEDEQSESDGSIEEISDPEEEEDNNIIEVIAGAFIRFPSRNCLAAAFPILAVDILTDEPLSSEEEDDLLGGELEDPEITDNEPILEEEDIGIIDTVEPWKEEEEFILPENNNETISEEERTEEVLLDDNDLIEGDLETDGELISDYGEEPGDGDILVEETPAPQPTPSIVPVPSITPTPEATPTIIPEPTPEENEDDYRANGEAMFYDTLTGDIRPVEGDGTKEHPYLFLSESMIEYITLKGSFLNRMRGYNPEGKELLNEDGYWYRIEFYEGDVYPEEEEEKDKSRLGFFLINGGEEPDGPWDVDYEKLLYLEDAEFPTITEETEYTWDGTYDEPYDGFYTEEPQSENDSTSRADAIMEKEEEIRSLEFGLKEEEIKLSKLRKKCDTKELYAKIDGTVSYAGDPNFGTSSMDSFLKVKSKEGFFVSGQVSEMMLDQVKPGQVIKCNTDMGETFEAEIIDVANYPDASGQDNLYYSGGNPNASMYGFTASILDKDMYLSEDTWLTSITLPKTEEENNHSITINKAFVRSENGRSYVMKDENGILKKQYVRVGKVDQYGYSITITGGLRHGDKLAFPYSQKAVEGTKTVDGTIDQLYGDNNTLY